MIFPLNCRVQTYAWGKPGPSSKVAQLAAHATHPPLEVQADVPYAELWMGTHPSAPSTVLGSSETLKSQLSQALLSPKVHERFAGDLPFLFKVLSVNKALSIQAHPDKKLAEELHAKRPDLYKDDNHKPEMAIALTPFEGLSGFRPLTEIASHLRDYPEFANVVGQTVVDAFLQQPSPTTLQSLFASLMRSDPIALVMPQLKRLVQRMTKEHPTPALGSVPELLLRLNNQYPGDVGCFSVLVLNYVLLQPGEAMFLAANEPHAYLSGDCIECMATSDNVVRAGLTPKAKDVDVLVKMLTYRSYHPKDIVMKGKNEADGVVLYPTPIPEFSVFKVQLDATRQQHLRPVQGPSVILVTKGSGKLVEEGGKELELHAGSVLFLGAGAVSTVSTGESVTLFRAFCEL